MKGIVNWKNISILGDNKLVKKAYIYLVVVPILAKILSKVNRTLNFNVFGENIHIEFGLPFSWKIFYFAALSFSVGYFIYNWKAPKIIKENRSFKDFEDSGKQRTHLRDYLHDIKIDSHYFILRNPDVSVFFYKAKLTMLDLHKFNIEHCEKKLSEDFLSKLLLYNEVCRACTVSEDLNVILIDRFWKVYKRANLYNKYFIWVCFSFYFTGFVLMGIVFFESLVTVCKISMVN